MQGGCGIVWGEGRAATEWGDGGGVVSLLGMQSTTGLRWAGTVVPAGTAWGSATH